MSASVAPRPARVRLGTIAPSTKAPTPIYESATTKQKKLPQPAPKKQTQHFQCCNAPSISSDEGLTVCYNCGHVHRENAIVSEVTFGETAGGAAMVEGGFIAENQRHANSMGGTMRGLGGMASREQAEMLGRQEIERLGSSLYVRQAVKDQALSWYKLAMNHNFIQGRRMRNVAAVAIYMAARRQQDNTLMLMDLAEKVQVNVWALGDTYKAFLEKLREVDPAQLVGNKAVQEIEPLMLKYCRKLEFAEAAHRVADDACKLLKRMNRDWMVQGRQPAGLCGACIILAARMNNFRRTVREVVYVVKVADSTINSRLYEYKQTPSSVLTVNQFREFGQRLKVTTQPPAIWRREQREERKEKRKAAGTDSDSVIVLEGLAMNETEANPSKASRAPPRISKRRKTNNGTSQGVPSHDDRTNTPLVAGADLDALDGNGEAMLEALDTAMDDAEVDDVEDESFILPKKREIETEVTDTIKDWETIFKEFSTNEEHPLLKMTGWTAQQMTRAQLDRRDIPVSTSPDIGEDEFDDDPDVANCILGPEEVRHKERIWITENEDWLRAQQKKLLEAELEAAEDKPKKPKQKRKHHQMGDGSVLEGQPASSAADAAHKMLKKRSKQFSNHINYDRLKELFPGGNMASSPGATGSGLGASPAASQAVQTPPPTAVAAAAVEDEDAEGEEDDEYEEEVQYEEDEDEDENQYLADEDEGFSNENYDY
ncbi:Brf1-like TBP-binding domain-containing protein [Phaeosphaeriaceae sp. PMI808]|nr:Brf1-like TBP-binding domain-containing protein [Phaeosphaeriaceae sp. PMI808]